jgi:hypothetical protein
LWLRANGAARPNRSDIELAVPGSSGGFSCRIQPTE